MVVQCVKEIKAKVRGLDTKLKVYELERSLVVSSFLHDTTAGRERNGRQ